VVLSRNNTNVYERIAVMMATIHIGITVLCLYPRPKGRNPPFGKYAIPGFIIWNIVNKMRNNKMDNCNLYILTTFLGIQAILSYMMN